VRVVVVLPLLALACGPIPVQQAERECVDRARLAQKPNVEVFVGVNNRGGAVTGGGFEMSSDYLRGRDPSAVFTECVKSRSGQFPTRSFTEVSPAR
jgi:hypothetical protein